MIPEARPATRRAGWRTAFQSIARETWRDSVGAGGGAVATSVASLTGGALSARRAAPPPPPRSPGRQVGPPPRDRGGPGGAAYPRPSGVPQARRDGVGPDQEVEAAADGVVEAHPVEEDQREGRRASPHPHDIAAPELHR